MNNTKVIEGQSLEGILLYPTVDDDFDHQYSRSKDGKKISIKSIDLNQDFEKIKSIIDEGVLIIIVAKDFLKEYGM